MDRGIFPNSFAMPTTSSADAATIAAQDLVHTLQKPEPATPFTTVQSDQSAALATLSDLFFVELSQLLAHPPHHFRGCVKCLYLLLITS